MFAFAVKSRCEDISPKSGNGVYKVSPSSGQSKLYYCYRGTDNKFWNVIQYRYDGSLGFDRTWDDYKNGFGSVSEEFWLGNDEIHRLTIGGDAMLRIEMEGFIPPKVYAQYNRFYVANEQNKYQLTYGSYHGTAGLYVRLTVKVIYRREKLRKKEKPGDGFKSHNGTYFSTKYRDNDDWDIVNCAQTSSAGYWYNKCYYHNLNAPIRISSSPAMFWPGLGALKTSRMMVRRK